MIPEEMRKTWMRNRFRSPCLAVIALAILIAIVVPAKSNDEAVPVQVEEKKNVEKTDHSVYRHKMKRISGEEKSLGKYQGRVLLIVNVASQCGLTPQYSQLVELHEKYADKGLSILGFPANNFGSQEPGTNSEIRQFCSANYGVKFDMFEKISVKGEDIHPLYKGLTSKEENGGLGGEIKWNFTKFLVDPRGKTIARFEPQVKPDDPEVVKAIEKALK
jgi:glutathione peroxidase